MEPLLPSRPLMYVWAACRVLWIACLPLFVGVLLLISAINELRRGGSGLVLIALGLLGLALAWSAGRHTWRVFTAREEATRNALAAEVLGSGVGFTVLILLYLIITPYFSGMFRKSAEGAVKNDLARLRQAVAAHRAGRDGQAPSSLEDLGPIPPLWGRYAEVPHPGRAAALVVESSAPADTGKWAYVLSPSSPSLSGAVFIDCTHTDIKGSAWNSY